MLTDDECLVTMDVLGIYKSRQTKFIRNAKQLNTYSLWKP